MLPCNMMRSHTASTESQQGSEVNRVRNQGITKWTGDTPTSSWREERRGGGGMLKMEEVGKGVGGSQAPHQNSPFKSQQSKR